MSCCKECNGFGFTVSFEHPDSPEICETCFGENNIDVVEIINNNFIECLQELDLLVI